MEANTPQLTIAQRAAELRAKVISPFSMQPVPVVAVATHLGFTVSEFEPTPETRDISGAVQHDNKVIFVNASEGAARKRFTIAHEIGHIVLHGGDGDSVDYRRQMEYGYDDQPKEVQANQFAAELLMPRNVFEAAWNACGGNLTSVAQMLEVSQATAAIRASQFGLS